MKTKLILSFALWVVSSTSTFAATSITIRNPTPAANEYFGYAVAAVGTDRVLIGATDAGGGWQGEAYLFSIYGGFIGTIYNPTGASYDDFGCAVAAVGTGKVLIGDSGDNTYAADAGAAYLFTSSGSLLTNFHSPTPAAYDYFGSAVAGVGTDKVLIGSGGTGSAYLFSSSGTWLTTFTNPAPALPRIFGQSVAGVGTDKVLLGAYVADPGATYSGTAYLFSTNGTLLASFTKPTAPVSTSFGISVAAVGTDKVLIGADTDSTGGAYAGAAYLFSTNGTLLTTLTNPTPKGYAYFGHAVAGLGTDRVLIGEYGGAAYAGAAYVFSTNGTLLATFGGATTTMFGYAVAAVGTDKALIGAYADDSNGQNAGIAFLYSSFTPPSATTLPATPLTANSVTLNGTVNPNASQTTAWFEWGTTTSYGNRTAITNAGSGTSPVPVMLPITNLLAGTNYHCRIVASNSSAVVTGNDQAVPFPMPVVSTELPTAISSSGAALNGTVNPNGWPLTVWFEWGRVSLTNTAGLMNLAGGNATFPIRATVTGLVSGLSYDYRLVASNGGFMVHGAVQNFVVPSLPVVSTLAASSVTTNRATLNGTVNPMSSPARAWFEWGPTTNYGYTSGSVDAGSTPQVVPVNMSIGSLFSFTPYHFRLVATNAGGAAYGQDVTFTTPSGSDTPEGIHVSPTLLSSAGGILITATYVGGEFYSEATPPPFRIRMVNTNGARLSALDPVSISPTKLTFTSPALAAGFYGFVVQLQNAGQWLDVYESSHRFFKVEIQPIQLTLPYQILQPQYPTLQRNPADFLDTTPSYTATGVITGQVTVPHHVNDGDSFANKQWTKNFWRSGENGVKFELDFLLDNNATYNFSIPFEITIEIPATVYRGQHVYFTPTWFRYLGGDTLQVGHSGSYSTDHRLWLNVPYDGLSALDLSLSQRPDGLAVVGKLPASPDVDLWLDVWPFNTGDVSYGGVHNRLGGYVDFGTAGGRVESPGDGWRQVWTGETRVTDLWYSGGDQIAFLCATPIPYASQVACGLRYAGGVKLIQDFYMDVLCTDFIQVKPPDLFDLSVYIPVFAPTNYNIVANLSFPVDLYLVSEYIYQMEAGFAFDMYFIDEKDLGSWSLANVYSQQAVLNVNNVRGEFTLNTTVNTVPRTNWIHEYAPALPPDTDVDVMNYTVPEANAARARIANLTFAAPSPPLLITTATQGTFPDKPESEMALMLSTNPAAGGTITLAPPPVDGGYSNGTVVTVTAHAAAGYQFTGWNGDATGSNNPATITMNDVKSVTASFTTVTLTGAGYLTNGSFRFDVGGVTGLTCVVQWSTNLSTTDWLPLMTNTSPFSFTDANAGSYPQQFYRVLLLP
ncbi:MAG: hypothetical protein HY298_14135 [Verrucomicrobia bacterium]|nr:hypothetical protein [Verrucomicrobiota bacterium]